MKECEARGLGWADGGRFALSRNGKYDSSADLTFCSKAVVEDPTYGLLKLAKPATGI
jgi:hypothetical protein